MFKFFKKEKENKNEIVILSPVNGTVKPLEKVEDEVFSQKMMGDGVAITPSDNDFFSPLSNGEVKVAFGTGHAYGIESTQGPQVLIHIGIDTVNLKGEGFDAKVKVGSKVSSSTQIAVANIKEIKKKAPSIDTMVIIPTESIGEFKIEFIKESGEVKVGEPIFKLVK